MPNYRLQATIKTLDNLPANYATNTWYVNADNEAGAAEASTALGGRYNTFAALMSNVHTNTLGLVIKAYDMADPEPREPLFEDGYNLSAGLSDPLPTEVSIVLSYYAAGESGVPMARRRGRIYLPFMAEGNNDTVGRPSTTLVNAVAAFGAGFKADGVADANWSWVQYSPTAGVFSPVVGGWCDNEWDIQRRRGRIATSRTTFA